MTLLHGWPNLTPWMSLFVWLLEEVLLASAEAVASELWMLHRLERFLELDGNSVSVEKPCTQAWSGTGASASLKHCLRQRRG